MTYSPVSIVVPTIDDVISYSNNYDIEYTHGPVQRTENINNIKELKEETVVETSVSTNTKEEQNTQTNGVKKLTRIFKRKEK